MVMMRFRLLPLCLIFPNVWTDGSLVFDQVTGISASGAGFFSYSPDDCWRGNRWSILMMFVLMLFSVLVGFLLCSWTFAICSTR